MASSSNRPPLHPGVAVVAVVPDPWTEYWQTRNQVLTRLTRHFHVGWVTAPPHWRDVAGGRRPGPADGNPSETAGGMLIYDQRVGLPTAARPQWLNAWVFRQRVRRVRAIMRRRGGTTFVLYLWRPEFAPALTAARWDATCYHIDDEYTFSDVEIATRAMEEQLITAVDQVFLTSAGLFEKKGRLNPNSILVPNGCDYQAHAEDSPEPADLRAVPRPRIGYTGFLKQTLDWDLVRALATRHSDWSFVFVGPRRGNPEIIAPLTELRHLKNVFLLPPRPVNEITAYPQHFDVAIMPYRTDSHMNEYGYPLKLHEYLAAGCPVVGSPIRTLREFRDVVLIAGSLGEWSTALSTALDGPATVLAQCEARRAVARRHDWHALVGQIADAMLERLSERGAITSGGGPADGPRRGSPRSVPRPNDSAAS